jgi:hypothetical protein
MNPHCSFTIRASKAIFTGVAVTHCSGERQIKTDSRVRCQLHAFQRIAIRFVLCAYPQRRGRGGLYPTARQ